MTVRIGSCFAGIGGWELGLERAIPNSHTIWQVEQNTFCQSILKKHWPNATIFDDVRTVGADSVLCQHKNRVSTTGKRRLTQGSLMSVRMERSSHVGIILCGAAYLVQ